LLEAMGYGKAILISDIPENTDVLKGTGFVFHNKDEKDLGDKLLFALNNPELAKKAGEDSRALAQELYDWDKIVLRIEKLYREVQDRKSK
ncbi:MAG: glycosyltransferase family 4 protein, partial [Candidatus Moraniibacteriota bacterium]